MFGSLGSPLASDEVLEVSTDGINWVPVSDVSGTSWSYDDPANHSNDFSYLLRIVASDASVGAAASQEVRIDTGAPAATITLDDAITADGVINAVEAAGSIAIGGQVGGEASVGDVVTLSIGGVTYEGEVFDDDGTLRFSIEVPGSILADNPDRSVTASITPVDSAGNIGETATSSRDYGVDVSVEATITIDDLPDENTIATTAYRGLDISITGTAGADADEGDTVTVSVNGNDYDGSVDDSGRYSVDVPASELVDQDNPDGTERLLTATVTAQDEVDNEATATATTTALVRPVYEVQFTDSLVDGVRYSTTSGLTGATGTNETADDPVAAGSFLYRPGDTITLTIGNVTLAEFSADQVVGDLLFLQDIAGVGLEDVNLNYVENMAILLQSLDADGNPDNGIQITEATHEALADYVDQGTGLPLNMAEAGKQMLSNVLGSLGIEFTADTETDPDPSDGSQNVFETVALEHVADTITDSASDNRQPDLFDARLEDQIDAGQGVIEYAYITDGETVTAMTFSAYDISERTGQPVGLLANAESPAGHAGKYGDRECQGSSGLRKDC